MASGTAEREAALDLVDKACRRGFHPNTLAADQTYDTRHCVGELRQRGRDAPCGAEQQRTTQCD